MKMGMALMMGAILASQSMGVGMDEFLPRRARKPREPKNKMGLSEMDLEELAAFPDTKEGRKAKKKFLKDLK